MPWHSDNKRSVKSTQEIEVNRKDEDQLHYCKYCYGDRLTFLLTETLMKFGRTQTLRCCSECGSGLEIIVRTTDNKN